MTASTNVFTVTLNPVTAPRRHLRFISQSDSNKWWRIEEEWTGCQWRQVGRDVLHDVVIDVEFADVDTIANTNESEGEL